MIKKSTALILGAGASKPYGFPTGRELLFDIIDDNLPRINTKISSTIRNLGFKEDEIADFAKELKDSPFQSVDTFVINRPEYQEIGKAAIAAALIPREDRARMRALRNREDGPHWYEYLFNQIGTRKEEFQDNALLIVTFNYDRSLEEYFHLSLMHGFGLSEIEAAEYLAKIPIVHVYGQLGKYIYLDSKGRYYTPQAKLGELRELLSEMKILPESEHKSSEFSRASKFIHNADIVCFIGFGYDDTNLFRLGFEDWRHKFADRDKKRLLGTAFKFEKDECRRISRKFDDNIVLGDYEDDALLFLKRFPVFD